MKNILFSLSILSILLITSCGKDDEVQIGLSGSVSFDGNSINITNGLFGEVSEDGEYGATFFLADAPISYNSETQQTTFEGDALISVIIFSEGDSFESGTYAVKTFGGAITDGDALVIVADANNASSGGGLGVGGTVNITGSGNTFTLTFNVDFEDDVKLSGNATGGFEIIDISSVQ